STVDDTAIKCGKVKKLQNITKTEATPKEWLFCFSRLCTVEDTAGYAPRSMRESKKLQNITKTEATPKEWLFCFSRLRPVEDTAGYAPRSNAGK
ncbi:hypothetical protein ACFSMX_19975, partial [Flectobacillus roseus]|uniref:hypothetical protein n=1 Tax=Flectobacillus roseus TaxID=502259 RepID=UPI00362EE99C